MIEKTKTDYHIRLDDVKKHLRLDTDFTDDDGYVTDLIDNAVEIAENYIEADIAVTTNVLVFKDFSGSSFTIGESNLISITSIIDDDSNEYTVDELRKYYDRFTVTLTESIPESDVTVTFQTGYAEGKLPGAIRQGILVKIADMYDNGRSGFNFSNVKYEKVFENLMDFYRTKRFKSYPEQ